jgi:hypothetical protein
MPTKTYRTCRRWRSTSEGRSYLVSHFSETKDRFCVYLRHHQRRRQVEKRGRKWNQRRQFQPLVVRLLGNLACSHQVFNYLVLTSTRNSIGLDIFVDDWRHGEADRIERPFPIIFDGSIIVMEKAPRVHGTAHHTALVLRHVFGWRIVFQKCEQHGSVAEVRDGEVRSDTRFHGANHSTGFFQREGVEDGTRRCAAWFRLQFPRRLEGLLKVF